MRCHALLPVLFAMLAATSVHAQDAAAPADRPMPAAKPVKAKRVCRTEPVLGSNIPQSTCHTQAEWDAIDKATSADARDMMDHQPNPR